MKPKRKTNYCRFFQKIPSFKPCHRMQGFIHKGNINNITEIRSHDLFIFNYFELHDIFIMYKFVFIRCKYLITISNNNCVPRSLTKLYYTSTYNLWWIVTVNLSVGPQSCWDHKLHEYRKFQTLLVIEPVAGTRANKFIV